MNREQLESMNVFQLRSLDIKEKDDELLVQEVLNEKLEKERSLDPNRVILRSEETDSLTPEKEKELQAKLDAENGTEEMVETVTEVLNKPFCEFCDAKGPVKHKANCTKPKEVKVEIINAVN